jgi:protease II
MEDGLASPAVVQHLKREDAATEAYLASTRELQQDLYREMLARLPDKQVRTHSGFILSRPCRSLSAT